MKNLYCKIKVLLLLVLIIIFSGCEFFIREPHHVEIYPRGEMLVVAGETLYYSAVVKSEAGYDCTETAELSCSKGGTFNGNIFKAGTEPGVYKITAKYGDLKTTTTVKVLPEDYMYQPFEYMGNTYSGQTTEGDEEISINSEYITIEYPSKGNFDCDGFFLLKGSSSFQDYGGYFLVLVCKTEDLQDDLVGYFDRDYSKTAFYFLRGDFCERIWLRYGKGEYTIRMVNLTSLYNNPEIEGKIASNGEIYYGDITWWSFYSYYIEFKVNNTRDEDGRWLYPSHYCQSDDLRLINLVTDKTYGLSGNKEKADALNRYIVNYISYDTDSLIQGNRKKQDALSIYKYKTGVCIGFADLTAALFRICGIPTKHISGKLHNSDEIGHSWNNVSFDGGLTWVLLEPQKYKGYQEINYDTNGSYVLESKNAGPYYYAEDGSDARLVDEEEKIYLVEQTR